MNTKAEPAIRCTVTGGKNLPAELGGADSICATLEQAAAPALERAGISTSSVSIEVVVKSPSLITATASIGDKILPAQNVGASDRGLNPGAITMLADALAAQLGQVGQ